MHPLLSVEGLTVSFPGENGRVEALKSVSFGLQKGEVLALVGESGSGKSVTALSMLKLLPKPAALVESGRILFSPDGVHRSDLLSLSDKEMNTVRGGGISMVFQEPMTSLNPVITCGRQVAEAILAKGGAGRREARRMTVELFERVSLPDPYSMYDRYPHQLSGGQKQRVMIAMAMSGDPCLLIADEPTTALDVTVQKSILSLIRSFQREKGMGVVFITHDLGVVSDMADRVAVMYKGAIVEEGPVREVLTKPSNDYTRALLACRPGMHPRKSRLPVVADFIGGSSSQASGGYRAEGMPQLKRVAPERTRGEVLLQVRGLTVAYPGKKGSKSVLALDGVDFEVYRGETLGLVGESGCGKTTLGRAILGLVKPESGQVLLNGRDLARLDRREWTPYRKEMQIVFQDPYGSLNPRMTVGNAIAEPMAVHGVTRAASLRRRVVESLEMVDLLPVHFDRYPHEFSGGQRQRIGIARALSVDPSFIVFDEAVSALDVSVQAQVLNILKDLKESLGFTSLFISHDLSVVHHVCDRILVMKRGRIVESGLAEEVFSNPRDEYTRSLIESLPGGLGPRMAAGHGLGQPRAE
jgi:peptide/nickel transport system ATP-binding protein